MKFIECASWKFVTKLYNLQVGFLLHKVKAYVHTDGSHRQFLYYNSDLADLPCSLQYKIISFIHWDYIVCIYRHQSLSFKSEIRCEQFCTCF